MTEQEAYQVLGWLHSGKGNDGDEWVAFRCPTAGCQSEGVARNPGFGFGRCGICGAIMEAVDPANFATLADLLAGCVTLVRSDACSSLFYAATSPTGTYPKDTLAAAENIARYPWYQTERVFGLLNYLYPVPEGKNMRVVPYMPYLNMAPSAWVLPLKFTGGGYNSGGKAMFDSQGNLWVGDNFTVGWQGTDSLWQGNATKFDPNGKPLSPMTTGFTGGGMQGGTFGAAVDAEDNVWFGTYGGKSIAVFDKNGKPLHRRRASHSTASWG